MSFHDVTLPDEVARGARCDMAFATEIVMSRSGHEQRIGLRQAPQLEFSFELSRFTRAALDNLIAFARARRGPLYGFRMRDWSDYFAGLEAGYPSPGIAGLVPTAGKQEIGVGTGAQTVFPLVKTYVSGATTVSRRIFKPINDANFRVYVNGVLVTTGFTVDWTLGKLTFSTAPTSGHVVAFTCLFDVPVRFRDDRAVAMAMKSHAQGVFTLSAIELPDSEFE